MVRSLESSCWFRWSLSCCSEAETDIWHPALLLPLPWEGPERHPGCSTHWQLSALGQEGSSPTHPHFQLLELSGTICSHQELEVSPQWWERFQRETLPAEGMAALPRERCRHDHCHNSHQEKSQAATSSGGSGCPVDLSPVTAGTFVTAPRSIIKPALRELHQRIKATLGSLEEHS